MRILVFWDQPDEAELIGLYLNPGEEEESTEVDAANEVRIVTAEDEFRQALASNSGWEVLFLNLSWDDPEQAPEYFQAARRALPEAPIVGACVVGDVYRLASFITRGLRSYILRDASKDYIFLIQATLESAVERAHTFVHEAIARAPRPGRGRRCFHHAALQEEPQHEERGRGH